MNHLGSEYIVILNDPQLRDALITEAADSARSTEKSRASRLRLRLADALRALATCIEPRVPLVRNTQRRQPLFNE
jgi:hypothetical protein